MQFGHRRPGARRQNLVIRHQRAIDIRNHGRTFEWPTGAHVVMKIFHRRSPPMLRQLRPSLAKSASASLGPALPAG